MPPVELLARMGLYFERGLFAPQECARLCASAPELAALASQVSRGGASVIDEEERKSKRVQLPSGIAEKLHRQLLAAMPRVAAHFQVPLSACEEPQLLRYSTGDYFTPHRDLYDTKEELAHIRKRKISVVVFLNAPGAGGYEGGQLTFYGMVKDSGWDDVGFPLDAEPGLFVAFPSDTMHEVQPVTAGERLTLVSWYS